MEVEVKKPRFYRLSVANGEEVSVHEDIFAQFATLQNMLPFTGVENVNAAIPMPDWISKGVLEWIVNAYIIYRVERESTKLFEELYGQTEKVDQCPLSLLLDAEFKVKDLPRLFDVIRALNFLEAELLLLLTIDKAYRLIAEISTEELSEKVAGKSNKKKNVKEEGDTGLLLTPYYNRMKLIDAFVAQYLSPEIARSIKPLQKYANPIACGQHHQLYLKRDDLYGAGDNRRGQLGVDQREIIPHDLTRITTLPGKPLLVGAAYYHSFCVTSDGLYSTGSNNYGVPIKRESTWHPIVVSGEVLLLETSAVHVVILTTTGLYAAGSNYYGQLGVGNYDKTSVFTRVDVDGDVLDIKVSDNHTIVLTSTGLYGCGSNKEKQLGDVSQTRLNKLTLLSSTIRGVTHIACDNYWTMMVVNGDLYGTGRGTPGVLLNERPEQIQRIGIGIGKVASVYSGERYCMILTTLGDLYGAGENEFGQLGVGDRITDQRVFRKVIGIEGEIKSVSCSVTETYVLTTDGLYYSGSNISCFYSGTVGVEPYVSTVFIKLLIDMGYSWPKTLSLEDEPVTKQQRLQCEYCHGKARFIAHQHPTLSLPYCSKYCSCKSKFQ